MNVSKAGAAAAVWGDLLLGGASWATTATDDDAGPSDEKLRQHFRFCIGTDDGHAGRDSGWRRTRNAATGMQEPLYHAVVNHGFPPS